MATTSVNLEALYSRLSLEEEDGGGVVVGRDEVRPIVEQFVLVGRFLTEKNINFQAMQNVLASLWKPKEGLEIWDIGGRRYVFDFFHKLDLQKVLEGGPWTFEQSLLLYQRLENNEDPHTVQINTMDIWVQVYDLPTGMLLDRVLQSIENSVGTFVATDPKTTTGGWQPYVRIRVKMDVRKPIKRRLKIKRGEGEWGWVNFKYE